MLPPNHVLHHVHYVKIIGTRLQQHHVEFVVVLPHFEN